MEAVNTAHVIIAALMERTFSSRELELRASIRDRRGEPSRAAAVNKGLRLGLL